MKFDGPDRGSGRIVASDAENEGFGLNRKMIACLHTTSLWSGART
jgi:hypothetical protein